MGAYDGETGCVCCHFTGTNREVRDHVKEAHGGAD